MEIYFAISANVSFRVCLPVNERIALKKDIDGMFKGSEGSFQTVMDVLAKVDGERAEAESDSDRDMIFQAIREDCGFEVLNTVVKYHIRKWFVETCITRWASLFIRMVITVMPVIITRRH